MIVDLTPGTLVLLAIAAFVAGVVDAVAGGGGLITLPALLAAGLPPHMALGTNKGQSVWGSGAALFSYARAGLVRADRAKITFPLGICGAVAGAWLLLQVPSAFLKPLVLGLLVAVAVFLAFRPKLSPPKDAGNEAPTRPPVRAALAAAIAFSIALYDGFFGPGTGTFLILCFVLLLHETALRASAEAKVVNFASNLASCGLFAAAGMVVWKAAIPMAAGQFIGATIGARMTVRKGDGLVRRIVLLVVLGTCAKLAWDLWNA
ncbi:MAG: TSUP family transporter [Planctomycetes bacterium]|nr:TSUP family transporter [Planctomycetota bacterium]